MTAQDPVVDVQDLHVDGEVVVPDRRPAEPLPGHAAPQLDHVPLDGVQCLVGHAAQSSPVASLILLCLASICLKHMNERCT